MTQHKHDDDDNLKRQTPSQAEGEEDMIEAELDPTKRDKPDDDLVRETPSQAEGSRETVNEMIDDQHKEQRR